MLPLWWCSRLSRLAYDIIELMIGAYPYFLELTLIKYICTYELAEFPCVSFLCLLTQLVLCAYLSPA